MLEAGARVPEDVAVLGFDDVDLAEVVGLTTIRQPLREGGVLAADLLLGGDRARRARSGRGVPGAERGGAADDLTLDAVLSSEGWPYASSGAGRFHCLFGRDSLITSLQVLPARPDVARATVAALGALVRACVMTR